MRHLAPALLLMFALAGRHPSLLAQTAKTAADDGTGEDYVRLAPVLIDGEVLFSVRGISAHPAERRAAEIANRIRKFAADPRVAINSLTLEARPGGTWILCGGQRVMVVLDEDAAVDQIGRETLAHSYSIRIGE